MQPLIELMLLAAAVDGNIDDAERITILQSLARRRDTGQITEQQIYQIKQELLRRLQQGHTREGIIHSAAQSLDHDRKLLSYAIAVEVVLCNNELIQSEVEYLRLLGSALELHPEEIASIHFSARIRHGFGDFS